MSLSPGSRLGVYEVGAKIGEGGMGEVYRARDTKLNRDVALKVLPDLFASDPDRLARFQREAQLLASLNHPNIGAIYGLEESDGIQALALELIEGPTLADRIADGPLSVDEALPIARQIADALEAAHEQGIIHRDLKPANVKVKDDGTVKVLDFGLAKALEGETGGDPSQSPTLTAAATQAGVIMGTAAYMAPEQAKGKAADKRADIWAFGIVLLEMLSGQRVFAGETISETLADVMKTEPSWDQLPADLPSKLGNLLRRCLQKDPRQRVRDIGDVRLAMEGAFETTVSAPAELTGAPQLQVWQRPVPAAIAALVVAAVAVLGGWVLKPTATPPVSRYAVSVAPSAPVQLSNNGNDLTISPDGSRVIYQAADDMLHVRALDQLAGVPLRGTENALHPFVSANGAWVGFMAGAGGPMQKVSILGGPPVTICELPANLRGASWGSDDTIIFGTASSSGLMRVSGAGGEPEAITTSGDGRHMWPEILPEGAGVLFTDSAGPGPDDDQVALLDLQTGEHHVIIPSGTFAQYSPTGHIVYGLEGTLRAVTFDLDTRQVTGDPGPVLEGVVTKGGGSSAASFDLSETGSLVYVSGEPEDALRESFVWVDRDGREEHLPLPPRDYYAPRLSPDGTRLAVSVVDGLPALFVYDVVSAAGLRLTQESVAMAPVWTPDGDRIVFRWSPAGSADLYWVPAEGSGEIESLTTSDDQDTPTGITPDGASILFVRVTGDQREVWQVSLEGERSPIPVLQGEFARGNADISPDGNWLVYRSDQSGSMEIYLQPYPGPGPTIPVSIGGGDSVTWSADGSELFYRVDDRMMAVEVRSDGTVSTPTELFSGEYVSQFGGIRQYHVGPDGRFLMLKASAAETGDQQLTQVVLVQNWFQELIERVPIN